MTPPADPPSSATGTMGAGLRISRRWRGTRPSSTMPMRGARCGEGFDRIDAAERRRAREGDVARPRPRPVARIHLVADLEPAVHRRRSDHRSGAGRSRSEEESLRAGRSFLRRRDDPGHEHVLDLDLASRGIGRAARPLRRTAFFQSAACDEADRDRARRADVRRDRRARRARSRRRWARPRSSSATRPASPRRDSASPSVSRPFACSKKASPRPRTSIRRWSSATTIRWDLCASPTWSASTFASASPISLLDARPALRSAGAAAADGRRRKARQENGRRFLPLAGVGE